MTTSLPLQPTTGTGERNLILWTDADAGFHAGCNDGNVIDVLTWKLLEERQ